MLVSATLTSYPPHCLGSLAGVIFLAPHCHSWDAQILTAYHVIVSPHFQDIHHQPVDQHFVSLPATTCRTDMNILADPENMEAISTAHVLAKLMAPLMMGVIFLCQLSSQIRSRSWWLVCRYPVVPHLIVLCTDQCLVSYYYASWLLQARHLRSCFAVPVVADDIFEIPSPVKIGKLVQSSRLQGLETIDTQAYAHVLKSIFLEIALPFLRHNLPKKT